MTDLEKINAYIESLPLERKNTIKQIRKVIQENLPVGFEETFGHRMMGYSVPLSVYPAGYHASPKEPVPFLGLASQKHYIALYHLGLYMNEEVLKWFVKEYPKHSKQKLDMGKSCIRFKKMEDIPYQLIGELCIKITLEDYLATYLQALSKRIK